MHTKRPPHGFIPYPGISISFCSQPVDTTSDYYSTQGHQTIEACEIRACDHKLYAKRMKVMSRPRTVQQTLQQADHWAIKQHATYDDASLPLFESYTMTASELKRKVDNNEPDAPKKLPVQEVASRFASLQAKLDPIRIESVMEPSHQLINLIAQCLEDGRVRYIEWSRCTTRS